MHDDELRCSMVTHITNGMHHHTDIQHLDDVRTPVIVPVHVSRHIIMSDIG